MNVIYQLWGLGSKKPDWQGLIRKLEKLQHRHPASALICGIDAPKEVYDRVFALAGHAPVYLWYPVFSELDGLCAFDPLLDAHDRDYLAAQNVREFRFRCPNSQKNREAAFQDALRRLREGKFSGIFMDRIRYPSFQFGLSGVLGCFCPECKKAYRAAGIDPEALRQACLALEEHVNEGETDPLGLVSFDGHRWTLKDLELQALLDARCKMLSESVGGLCKRFRDAGYKIGLDLFSPALAYFAGQDFDELLPLADFAKPMLYLHTDAPAGLPYEIRVLEESLGQGNTQRVLSLCGTESMDEFAKAEIRGMKERYPHTKIFCGMEYNRVPPIAQVGPAEIRHSLQVFRAAGAEGVVPSWSLLSAPEENAEALTDALDE